MRCIVLGVLIVANVISALMNHVRLLQGQGEMHMVSVVEAMLHAADRAR